ncbi:MAG: TrmH family RNA methyltransferase, partial [Spirosomataceae bacterium]
TVVIMGSEEDGISESLIRQCDFVSKIPMSGNVSSLNVSVATAVILYEIVRQRLTS